LSDILDHRRTNSYCFQQTPRIVGCEKRGGPLHDPGDVRDIVRAIDAQRSTTGRYVHTCSPGSHGGVAALKAKKAEAQVIIHQQTNGSTTNCPNSLADCIPTSMGRTRFGLSSRQDVRILHDGQIYDVGELHFTVIHTPDIHRDTSYWFEPVERKFLSADVLFGLIGRQICQAVPPAV